VRAALARLGLAGPAAESPAPATLAARLAALTEGVATPLEAKLARLLPSPARPPIAPAIAGQTAGQGSAPTEVQEAPSAPAASQALLALRDTPGDVPDLRLLIERALAATAAPESAGAGPDGSLAPRGSAVAEALTQLAGSIEFAQLANAARTSGADPRQTVWLPLPLPPGPDGQAPTLAVTRWAGGDRADQPERLRATLNLALQHLGDLTVVLDLRGRQLRCDIQADTAGVSLIQPALGDLTDRLAALGYAVDTATTVAAPSPLPAAPAPLPRRIDQRA
jgi:hypothetical protein